MQKDILHPGTKADSGSDQIFFWSGQDALADHLADQMAAPAALAFDPAALTLALSGRGRVVVLWRGPDADLAACLESGLPVAAALEDWKEQARGLTALFRKNRRTMILAEAEALRSGGTAALALRLGLQVAPSLPQTLPTPSPLAQALTHLALQQDEDLRLLLEELVSSSLAGPDVNLGAVLELAVAQATRTSQDLSALQAENARISARLSDRDAEAEMLREQVLLNQTALTDQSNAAQAAAGAAALRLSELEQVLAKQDHKSAALQAETNSLSARLADRDAEALRLAAQVDLQKSAMTSQSIAAQEAASAAATRIAALEQDLAKQQKQAATAQADTKTLTSRLAERDAEAQKLRSELDAQKSALTDHSKAAEAAASAAAKRISGLEQDASRLEKHIAALVADTKSLNTRVASREDEAQKLRDQVEFQKSALEDQSNAAQASALRIKSLEDQLAWQEKNSTKLLSEGLALSARLAEREAETRSEIAELIRARSALLDQITGMETAAQAAALRIDTLEGALAAQGQSATDLEGQLAAADQMMTDLSAALALERKTVEQVKTVQDDLTAQLSAAAAQSEASALEKSRLAADLGRRVAEVEVMSQQVQVLQDSLSQVVETSASDRKLAEANAKAAASAQRNDEWDLSLAKALAASRSEAELRATLEQELEAVKAKLQSRIQREADLNFNQKLFTQMTQDATASLDEIARLVAVQSGPLGGSGMAPHS